MEKVVIIDANIPPSLPNSSSLALNHRRRGISALIALSSLAHAVLVVFVQSTASTSSYIAALTGPVFQPLVGWGVDGLDDSSTAAFSFPDPPGPSWNNSCWSMYCEISVSGLSECAAVGQNHKPPQLDPESDI